MSKVRVSDNEAKHSLSLGPWVLDTAKPSVQTQKVCKSVGSRTVILARRSVRKLARKMNMHMPSQHIHHIPGRRFTYLGRCRTEIPDWSLAGEDRNERADCAHPQTKNADVPARSSRRRPEASAQSSDPLKTSSSVSVITFPARFPPLRAVIRAPRGAEPDYRRTCTVEAELVSPPC